MQDNKSIVFLTISFICVWLTLDSVYGKQYLHRFLANVFPFYSMKKSKLSETLSKTHKDNDPVVKAVEEKKKNGETVYYMGMSDTTPIY